LNDNGIGKRKSVRTASGIMLTLLLVSMLSVAFDIRQVRSDWTWTETIYIRADGSIYPVTAPMISTDNVTYTLTDNIIGNVSEGSSAIIIERANIIIEGAGHAVQSTALTVSSRTRSNGIYLFGTGNVTVKDININVFWFGIYLNQTSYNSIFGNNITNSNYGVYLESSSHNTISGNNIANNGFGVGVYLVSSFDNSVSGNTFTNNGLTVWSSYQNSVENNTVNGRPLIFLEDVSNFAVDDAGQVVLVRCENIRVEGLDLSRTAVGVELWETSNSTISVNKITDDLYGIYSCNSSGNSISENSITDNAYGVGLDSSSGNSIFHNSFVNNKAHVDSSSGSVNVWDNGYPYGGNYWSDYNGADLFNGAYQNVTGSDGIGDKPYIIDANNTDGYPFMPPWGTGDIDGDGKVTLMDLVLLAMAYGSHPGDLKWNADADINNNGIVNFSDLVSLAKCYGKTYT